MGLNRKHRLTSRVSLYFCAMTSYGAVSTIEQTSSLHHLGLRLSYVRITWREA